MKHRKPDMAPAYAGIVLGAYLGFVLGTAYKSKEQERQNQITHLQNQLNELRAELFRQRQGDSTEKKVL
jgi:uncharacterized membrane-anchored protein YhcB (DUF1043 family)